MKRKTFAIKPVIDRETFAKVQDILKERAEAVPTYPFTGKIRCGVCGHPFTGKKGRVRGKTYIHWICRGKKETGMTCSSVNFGEEELEAGVRQLNREMNVAAERIEKCIGENACVAQDQDKYAKRYDALVDFMTVCGKDNVWFTFKNGIEIKA